MRQDYGVHQVQFPHGVEVPGGPVLGLCAFTAKCLGSIPCWGTKNPQAVPCPPPHKSQFPPWTYKETEMWSLLLYVSPSYGNVSFHLLCWSIGRDMFVVIFLSPGMTWSQVVLLRWTHQLGNLHNWIIKRYLCYKMFLAILVLAILKRKENKYLFQLSRNLSTKLEKLRIFTNGQTTC